MISKKATHEPLEKMTFAINKTRIIFLNKRSVGHIAHLRKQFNTINTYDHNVDKEKKKNIINFMRIYWLFI